jgi:metal-sulfur cluster biosynthetic enzyme
LTLVADWHLDEPRLRVAELDGRTALGAVTGQPVISARARLRFGPGRTCEPIARLLDRAIVQAEGAGLDPALLVVADGSVQAAEDIIRVRRKAHGVADWIHSPTCRVRIILRPAGLHATSRGTSRPEASRPPGAPAPAPLPPGPPARVSDSPAGPDGAGVDGAGAAAVREALSEVIDPDLGVNIVDLGFVRAVRLEERTAVITMTLTSAACPLTGIMEDQIRTELAPLGDVDGFVVDWQWIPAWRPADITDSGREQLHAIGFTI